MNFNLVSKANFGIVSSLLLVILLSQSRLIDFSFKTVLGRIILVILILAMSYSHKILGVVGVLLIVIMFNVSDIMLIEGAENMGGGGVQDLENCKTIVNSGDTTNPNYQTCLTTINNLKSKVQSATTSTTNPSTTTTTPSTTTPSTTTPSTTTPTTSSSSVTLVTGSVFNDDNGDTITVVSNNGKQVLELVPSGQTTPTFLISNGPNSFFIASPTEITATAVAGSDGQPNIQLVSNGVTTTYTPASSSTSTTVQSFQNLSIEGFDVLGMERNLQQGKRSNSIPVHNNNADNNVLPSDLGFFSGFSIY
jgi:hypothetical protein